MPILADDIKLFASERMTDNPDGGGRITGNEIVDGASNSIFPDVGDVDTAYGAVSLRLVYPAVQSNDTAVFYNSRVPIIEPPADPIVSVVAFAAASANDSRADARNRVESYVTRGPQAQIRLLSDQVEGQSAVQFYQRPEERLPEVGEVYVLSIEDAALAEDGTEQYVRVADVDSQIRTFSELSGGQIIDFDARVVTLGIQNTLRFDFPGSEPSRLFQHGSTVVRETQVADAADYFGTAGVDQAAGVGDLSLQLDSIYKQIVPTTQSETPVTDAAAATLLRHDEQSGTETVTVASGTYTKSKLIKLANRGYAYTFNLQPLPAKGAVRIEYRALGRWYTVQGRGDGKLEGDGAGTVTASTGSVSVTLDALPDADSTLIAQWATPAQYTDRAGTVDVTPPEIRIDASEAIGPGTATVTWETDGDTMTATDDGAGNLSGDATGRVYYTGPEKGARLRPATFPDSQTTYQLDYTQGADAQETVNTADSGVVNGGAIEFTLGQSPEPGSVTVRVPMHRLVDGRGAAGYTLLPRVVQDDGAGGWVDAESGAAYPGSIDYSTGDCTIDPRRTYSYTVYRQVSQDWGTLTYSGTGTSSLPITVTSGYSIGYAWEGSSTAATESYEDGALVEITYQEQGASIGPVADATSTARPLVIDLLPDTLETAVPGTLKFVLGGSTFVDRDGSLYRDPGAQTAGTYAGTFNYSTKRATLEDYPGGGDSVDIRTLLTRRGEWSVAEAQFRTPGSPLQPASVFVQASDIAGGLIQATADFSGRLQATGIEGEVDVDTGVVNAWFGDYVVDADLTTAEKNEPWYDPANVEDDGTIFRPREVLPGSITFNCVVLQTIPLDATILGLDPVRLPPDGQVPIFRQGDLAMAHHTQRDTYADLNAGQVLDANRVRLARAWIEDSTGTRLDPELYTLDRDAGTATMANPLDLSAYTAPYTFVHRVEDLRMVSDAEIGGRVTLTRALSHDFPAGEAYFSSLILGGELQARVANIFDQQTWTDEWSDGLIGDPVGAAEANTTTYPIQVTNLGAVTERWAIIFTGATSFKVVGETFGEIAVGDTSTQLAPANPNNGQPLFVIDPLMWGNGWSTNNAVRFNTIGSNFGVWLLRAIQQGTLSGESDRFSLAHIGNVNAAA